jgi:hypothetical protein
VREPEDSAAFDHALKWGAARHSGACGRLCEAVALRRSTATGGGLHLAVTGGIVQEDEAVEDCVRGVLDDVWQPSGETKQRTRRNVLDAVRRLAPHASRGRCDGSRLALVLAWSGCDCCTSARPRMVVSRFMTVSARCPSRLSARWAVCQRLSWLAGGVMNIVFSLSINGMARAV